MYVHVDLNLSRSFELNVFICMYVICMYVICAYCCIRVCMCIYTWPCTQYVHVHIWIYFCVFVCMCMHVYIMFIDSILQPLLHNIPSLITDTNDFIRKLDDINHLITPESTMITMDINSLHTNIPHTDGINACCSFPNRHITDPSLINDIQILIDFILTHNLFKFNNDKYLQIKSTAMGTKIAPAYAYIFMDAIKTSFLSANHLRPSIYYRYIDDIFPIWPHGNDTLFTTR